MARVTLGGTDLAGLTVDRPAASIRVLMPAAGAPLVFPQWAGNEFLLPDGTRPLIRTLTPRRIDPDRLELDLEIVVHELGVAAAWAITARPDDPAAVSGPGRGYDIDPDAEGFLLAGDETAIPAIGQLLEAIPDGPRVTVHIEIAAPEARVELPTRACTDVSWHDADPDRPPGTALVAAVRAAAPTPGERVWAAGEAAAVQQIRQYLFQERAWPRAHAWIRGYWKYGRAATPDD